LFRRNRGWNCPEELFGVWGIKRSERGLLLRLSDPSRAAEPRPARSKALRRYASEVRHSVDADNLKCDGAAEVVVRRSRRSS